MKKILIVEDEENIARGLLFNLEEEGFEAVIAESGEKALDELEGHPHVYDAVVLDIMLGGIDGFEVAKRLREARNFIPILMLTARNRPEDVLKGFESGTDDYVAKPFDLAVFLARLHGLLRRSGWQSSGEATEEQVPESFDIGNLVFDFQNLELRSEGEAVPLTLMEAKLLRHLVQNPNRAVSRKEILGEVWGLHEETDTRAIDNFIVRLRRHLEEDATKPKFLLTVRGVGYKFSPAD